MGARRTFSHTSVHIRVIKVGTVEFAISCEQWCREALRSRRPWPDRRSLQPRDKHPAHLPAPGPRRPTPDSLPLVLGAPASDARARLSGSCHSARPFFQDTLAGRHPRKKSLLALTWISALCPGILSFLASVSQKNEIPWQAVAAPIGKFYYGPRSARVSSCVTENAGPTAVFGCT